MKKGELNTESHSYTNTATQREWLEALVGLTWTSVRGKIVSNFKVISQLNTTGEAKLTEMEITYRQKHKRTNGSLVLARIIMCMLRLN